MAETERETLTRKLEASKGRPGYDTRVKAIEQRLRELEDGDE